MSLFDVNKAQVQVFGNSVLERMNCQRKLDFDKLRPADSSAIFIRCDKREDWANLHPDEKKLVLFNILEEAKKFDNRLAVEMLCQIIEDLDKKILEIQGKGENK